MSLPRVPVLLSIKNPYKQIVPIDGVIKPFETRPVSVSTKKLPGFCVKCSAVATTEALFQLEDAILVQRYCDKCLPDAQY